MITILRSFRRGRAARLAACSVLGFSLSSCNLDVFDPDIITPESLGGPESIPVAIAGLVGDFQLAYDDYVLYAGLFTDEFILAGTFPTRQQVDFRTVDTNNISLNSDLWEQIHTNRFSADNAVATLQPLVGDPEFEADQELINQGVAFGQFYGAYSRVMMAEMFCASILGGGREEEINYEGAPVSPTERMQDALALFQQAEASATAAGEADVATAARVGQARAQMFLGNYSQAASVAGTVDPDFEFVAEYSSNLPAQYNEVYTFTYGDSQVLRWTVGDGSEASRNFERFAFYDEWSDVGLLDPDPPFPTFSSFDATIEVHLQLIYGGGEPPPSANGQRAPIFSSTGFEADIMRAEAAYRSGDLAGAAVIINNRLTTGDNPYGKEFAPVAFTGTFESDIREIGRAYEAGMWLTGHRLHFFRRVFLNDGLDLWWPGHPGSDTTFPIPQQEIDNNPDVSQGCASGPPWN